MIIIFLILSMTIGSFYIVDTRIENNNKIHLSIDFDAPIEEIEDDPEMPID